MLRYAAKFLSVIFHPLLMVTYMLILLLLVNPYMFGVNSIGEQWLMIIQIFLSTFFIPMIAVIMMFALDFIKSIEMHDRMDRIIPYIAISTFYVATYYFHLKMPGTPVAFQMFMLGVVISLFLAFFINNFTKISMHTVGMGGFLGMILLTIFFFQLTEFPLQTSLGTVKVEMTSVLFIVLLLSGLVGSSRLILNAHHPSDLWGGYVVGLFGQLIAFNLVF